MVRLSQNGIWSAFAVVFILSTSTASAGSTSIGEAEIVSFFDGVDEPLGEQMPGPEGFQVEYNESMDAMVLTWSPPSGVPDVSGFSYNVYKNGERLAHRLASTTFIDPDYFKLNLYQVTVDYSEEESAAASKLVVAGDIVEELIDRIPHSCKLLVVWTEDDVPFVFYSMNSHCGPIKTEVDTFGKN